MITFNALILGLEGNVGVAAYGVTANLSLVVTSIYTGIAQGSQPLISRAWGEREPRLARLYLRYGLWTMLAVSGVIYLILFVFAGPIAGIFNSEHDPDLQRIAVEGLRLYFLSAPFAGFNIVLASYFTSVEQAAPAPGALAAARAYPDHPGRAGHGGALGHDGGLAGLPRRRAAGGTAGRLAVPAQRESPPLRRGVRTARGGAGP